MSTYTYINFCLKAKLHGEYEISNEKYQLACKSRFPDLDEIARLNHRRLEILFELESINNRLRLELDEISEAGDSYVIPLVIE